MMMVNMGVLIRVVIMLIGRICLGNMMCDIMFDVIRNIVLVMVVVGMRK